MTLLTDWQVVAICCWSSPLALPLSASPAWRSCYAVDATTVSAYSLSAPTTPRSVRPASRYSPSMTWKTSSRFPPDFSSSTLCSPIPATSALWNWMSKVRLFNKAVLICTFASATFVSSNVMSRMYPGFLAGGIYTSKRKRTKTWDERNRA